MPSAVVVRTPEDGSPCTDWREGLIFGMPGTGTVFPSPRAALQAVAEVAWPLGLHELRCERPEQAGPPRTYWALTFDGGG